VRNTSANSGKVESGFQGDPSKLASVCPFARPCEIHSRTWSDVIGPYSLWSPPTILYMLQVYSHEARSARLAGQDGTESGSLLDYLKLATGRIINEATPGGSFRHRLNVMLLSKFVQVLGETFLDHVELLNGVVDAGLVQGFDRGFAGLIYCAKIINRGGQWVATTVVRQEVLLFSFLFLATTSQHEQTNERNCT
jgi:hypothetical protein